MLCIFYIVVSCILPGNDMCFAPDDSGPFTPVSTSPEVIVYLNFRSEFHVRYAQSWIDQGMGPLKFPRLKRSPMGRTVWYMGVSKNRGTPKWMVYNGKPY